MPRSVALLRKAILHGCMLTLPPQLDTELGMLEPCKLLIKNYLCATYNSANLKFSVSQTVQLVLFLSHHISTTASRSTSTTATEPSAVHLCAALRPLCAAQMHHAVLLTYQAPCIPCAVQALRPTATDGKQHTMGWWFVGWPWQYTDPAEGAAAATEHAIYGTGSWVSEHDAMQHP